MRFPGLPFCAAIAAISFAAASAARGSGGGSSSPTPTVTPTPGPPDSCQIVWFSPDGTNPLLKDEFIVDAPIEDWVAGTMTYTFNAPLGVFYDNVDDSVSPPTFQAAAVTTAGTFDVTLGNGTTSGGSVTFNDSTNQIFYSSGVKVASNGTGTFTGVWSDPKPAAPVGGTGNIVIFWQGTSLNIGGGGLYAQCYHAAPSLNRFDRMLEAAARVPQRAH